MKYDKNYKMNKMTKIMLSLMPDQSSYSLVKKAFIEAEQHAFNSKKKMSVKHIPSDTEE